MKYVLIAVLCHAVAAPSGDTRVCRDVTVWQGEENVCNFAQACSQCSTFSACFCATLGITNSCTF